MGKQRFWIVNGQRVDVSNQVHDCLKNGRKKMHVLEAKNREMQMFSFSEDNSEERLMSECSGLSSEIEDESLLRIIMDEAIGKLTVRNQFIIRTIFYEEYTAADLARKEGSCQRQIRRERDRALEQLQLVLGDMGITRLEDLY